jgi:hypothetical protein
MHRIRSIQKFHKKGQKRDGTPSNPSLQRFASSSLTLLSFVAALNRRLGGKIQFLGCINWTLFNWFLVILIAFLEFEEIWFCG